MSLKKGLRKRTARATSCRELSGPEVKKMKEIYENIQNTLLANRSSVLFQAIWIIGIITFLIGSINLFKTFILDLKGYSLLQISLPIIIGFFCFYIFSIKHPKGFFWAFTSNVSVTAVIIFFITLIIGILKLLTTSPLDIKAWMISIISIFGLLYSILLLKRRMLWKGKK